MPQPLCLSLKSEPDRPGHPDSRDPLPDEAGSEHIRELLPANVQSCAEYEQLFDKCLDADAVDSTAGL